MRPGFPLHRHADVVFNADGTLFADCYSAGHSRHKGAAMASFIVRACNAHDDLLAALKAVMPYATMMEVSMTAEAMSGEGGEPADNYLSAIADARAAITKAEGER